MTKTTTRITPTHSQNSVECPTCRKYFSSESAFDRHRYGPHTGVRRCHTTSKLLSMGYAMNRFGRWGRKSRKSVPTAPPCAGTDLGGTQSTHTGHSTITGHTPRQAASGAMSASQAALAG